MQFRTQNKFYDNNQIRSENVSIYSKSCSKLREESSFMGIKKNYSRKLGIFNGWLSEIQEKQLEDRIKKEVNKTCMSVEDINIKNKLQNYIINHYIL